MFDEAPPGAADDRSVKSTKRIRRVSAVTNDFEREARSFGYTRIAGLDEVGRGALAGPVVAAAVILDPQSPLPEGLDDSKRLSLKQRERLAEEVRSTALAFAIGAVEAAEIDRINILQATKRAMLHALSALDPRADFLLIDALALPESNLPHKSIVGGDALSASIAAASIVAKVYRDNLMREFDAAHPGYGFARHVGYGTQAHLTALRQHGACPLHRRSFSPVKAVMNDE